MGHFVKHPDLHLPSHIHTLVMGEAAMKYTYTPGPWEVKRVPIESKGGSNTCWVIGPFKACIYDDWRARENGISESENEANAYLIAAARDYHEHAYNLAMLILQSDLYRNPDIRDEVDNVLAIYFKAEGRLP